MLNDHQPNKFFVVIAKNMEYLLEESIANIPGCSWGWAKERPIHVGGPMPEQISKFSVASESGSECADEVSNDGPHGKKDEGAVANWELQLSRTMLSFIAPRRQAASVN